MSRITLKLICDVACEYSGFSLEDLRSERRSADLVLVRQHAAWLGRKLTRQSAAQIGRFLSRDHTTILHAQSRIEDLRARDETFRALSDEMMLAIEAAAAAIETLVLIVPDEIDALAVARKILTHPDTTFSASTEEIRTLAAATIAGAKEADALAEQTSELAAAVSQYLNSHDAREAGTRADRLKAGAHILAARNHLEQTLEQWRRHHGDEDDESKEAECAGSGLAR